MPTESKSQHLQATLKTLCERIFKQPKVCDFWLHKITSICVCYINFIQPIFIYEVHLHLYRRNFTCSFQQRYMSRILT